MVLAALAVTVASASCAAPVSPVEAVPTAHDEGTDAAAAASVYVHVSGAVAAPGLYVLHEGARVVDAIAAAGGFAPDAERSGVNLARPLSDGEQLVVPLVGAAPRAEHRAGSRRTAA